MLFLKIPEKVNLIINEDSIVIKGPLGQKIKKKSKDITLFFDKTTRKLWFLKLNLKENQKHFFLSILNKHIYGVLKGFSVKLNIIGVGYKAFLEESNLILKLGFSHNICYKIPQNIKIKIGTQKTVTLIIFGNDFQQVNQIAAEIRALKPTEPYKGKGIKYVNEIIKKKEGKKTHV